MRRRSLERSMSTDAVGTNSGDGSEKPPRASEPVPSDCPTGPELLENESALFSQADGSAVPGCGLMTSFHSLVQDRAAYIRQHRLAANELTIGILQRSCYPASR